MRVHRKALNPKLGPTVPPAAGLEKECLLDVDNLKRGLDLTSIIYDEKDCRKYPGVHGFGVHFRFSVKETDELLELLLKWRWHREHGTEFKPKTVEENAAGSEGCGHVAQGQEAHQEPAPSAGAVSASITREQTEEARAADFEARRESEISQILKESDRILAERKKANESQQGCT